MSLFDRPIHRPVRSPLPRLLSVLLGVGLIGAAWSMQPGVGARQTGAAAAQEDSTDRLIVKYRNADNLHALDAATLGRAQIAGNRAGVTLSHHRARGNGNHVLKLNKRLSLSQARSLADNLRIGDANVEYAEPDRILRAQLVPNDTSYKSQWDLYEATAGINAPSAWDKSTGAGVTVAVVDTGYRPHADLAANVVAGYDFIANTAVSNDGNGRDADASDPGDWTAAGECYSGSPASNSSWHGTHVAGTIAAVTNNATGVAGIAYGAKVMPVRVLGKCGGYTSDIADGVIWASGGSVAGVANTATPARVINMSLGGAGACDTTMQNAVTSARSRGTVVVVAAGNSNGDAANFFPASCAGVVTVAAVGRSGGKAYYSNFGGAVDVAAPGGDMSVNSADGILSTLNGGSTSPGADSYAYYQGTSMATPHVAAVAALMLAKNPSLTPDQVESLLKSTARAFPATCSQCGAGIIDASAAVTAAMGTTPVTPTPNPTVVTVNEVETNNTLAKAQSVTANPAKVNGSIASASDTDYYKLSVAAGKTLKAVLTPPATADYDLYAYNSNGSLMAWSGNSTGVTDALNLSNTAATAATIYLRIVYYSGTTGSTSGKYTLSLSQ
ncbi:MAG TPA: S8 family peptidase [Burkholderiaceae bacterium]|nr:S8 family peptidase [Burkholderiaceae bacterium]HMX11897.1 S8 family peptidase [Burkholderiaceae bacterium]HMY99812.1 S8 family peptidase [Burkholderiaceae bacterium]HNB44530.1 S8 family peptidase [Burkholderiaceae bacterium]HNG80463.1 S8 family peptidase [Burkholderiaceae bacterium]